MSRVLKRAKGHFTQWAGQFETALELTRRGFLVSLTLGNTPDTDLFCGRVEGGAFRIAGTSFPTRMVYSRFGGLWTRADRSFSVRGPTPVGSRFG